MGIFENPKGSCQLFNVECIRPLGPATKLAVAKKNSWPSGPAATLVVAKRPAAIFIVAKHSGPLGPANKEVVAKAAGL